MTVEFIKTLLIMKINSIRHSSSVGIKYIYEYLLTLIEIMKLICCLDTYCSTKKLKIKIYSISTNTSKNNNWFAYYAKSNKADSYLGVKLISYAAQASCFFCFFFDSATH